jgi:thiosulfate/3-mercaptopyruvate sulfurtransferase
MASRHARPLITPEALLERLGDDRLWIADVRWYLTDPARGRREYAAAHIPEAVFIDVDADLAGPTGPGRHPLPDPAVFAARMSGLGVGDESLVVAYDDVGGGNAARLWWMLDDLGHPDVAVLDGGIGAWIEAGSPLTAEVPHPRSVALHLRDRWTRVVDRDAVAARLGSVVLLDARAPERYRGDVEPVDPVPGHIPTAVNAPIAANLGPDGRFLPADELARRFRSLGAIDGDVVMSCGSGVNACQNALAVRIAGLPDPLLYEGSYSDWSRAGYPIATGAEPGAPPSELPVR